MELVMNKILKPNNSRRRERESEYGIEWCWNGEIKTYNTKHPPAAIGEVSFWSVVL